VTDLVSLFFLLQVMLNQWILCPLRLSLLLVFCTFPLAVFFLLTATKLHAAFQALPALFLAAFNIWILPVETYRLVRRVGHHRVSSIEMSFFVCFTIALLLSSFFMTTFAHALAETVFMKSNSLVYDTSEDGGHRMGVVSWLFGPSADSFYSEYLLMGIVVFTALQLFQLQRQSAARASSQMHDGSQEESETFLLSGRNAYLMPAHATDTKGYQYAIYIHIFYITCGFGARAPCIVLFGCALSGVKYLCDKVAQFRFFSDPISQVQVRPRFLRRGGQYVTLAAIKALSLSIVVPQVLFAFTLVSYRPLSITATMAGWATWALAGFTGVGWCVFVLALNADLDTDLTQDPTIQVERAFYADGEQSYVRPTSVLDTTSNSPMKRHRGKNSSMGDSGYYGGL